MASAKTAKSDNRVTLKELIQRGVVPAKRARVSGGKKNLYRLDKTEPACKGPFFHPTKKAKPFQSTSRSAVYYRQSECEPTYTKTTLKKEFGIKSVGGIEPVNSYYSQRARQDCMLYMLSQFPDAVITRKEDLSEFEKAYRQLKKQIESSYRQNAIIFSAKGIVVAVPDLSSIRFEFKKFNINMTMSASIKNMAKLAFNKSDEQGPLVLCQLASDVTTTAIIEAYNKSLQDTAAVKHEIMVADVYLKTTKDAAIQIATDALKKRAEEINKKYNEQRFFFELVNQKPYAKTFPASDITRNITIFSAPTNSGKTFKACQEIRNNLESSSQSGCFFPLRALASQAFDNFKDQGCKASLITGEERDIHQDGNLDCCTVETLDPTKSYQDVFIDEAQLLFDENREPAYARAILGAKCQNLYLAVAPSYTEALIKFIEKYTKEPVQVIEFERLCPLEPEPEISLSEITKGDIVISYSVRGVHSLAQEISTKGLKVGVIYGKMSPSSRKKMLSEFTQRDLDVLVSTDAIGMGISLPAKRVVFAEGTKFDGKVVRLLTKEEIRQVAGRAGRFGFYDVGYVTTLKNGPIKTKLPHPYLVSALKSQETYPLPTKFRVIPDKHIIHAAAPLSIKNALHCWEEAIKKQTNISISQSHLHELYKKRKILNHITKLSRHDLVEMLYITFPFDRFDIMPNFYQEMAERIESGTFLPLSLVKKHKYRMDRIESLEIEASRLTIMAQLQRIFPSQLPSEKDIYSSQINIGETLTEVLLARYAKPKTSKKKKKKTKKRQ